ncbi:MAG: M23 family metallopeptidase [Tannerella sp.]|nr:M23 family metallopeptidase [Tannerella sp.]
MWPALLAGWSLFFAEAQSLRNPLDFPASLSGNFGELRANHLHSGIDFKTQGVEGKSVHAVRDGYVCRIAVSPWGYGNVIYLAHPEDSLMTVYAHLQRFSGTIAAWVTERQYEAERFAIDLTLEPEQFPVKRGNVIGLSGNSGSSGGPHLHFEVRDLLTDEPLDPLPFFKEQIKDSRPPGVRAVMAHPVEGWGVVNASSRKQQWTPVLRHDGATVLNEQIKAWGKIGFSIQANDYMSGTTNVYGVRELSLFVDGEEIFHSLIDRFSFDETRCLNAWVDYETWRKQQAFFMKTFVEPGNRLRFITGKNRGFLTIDEPRVYHLVFLLTDACGNSETFAMEVIGEEQAIPLPDKQGTTPFFRQEDSRFGEKGIRLLIPEKSLYSHLDFSYASREDTTFFSDVHRLHDRPVPLHHPAHLSLFLLRDGLTEKRQYGIISLRNGRSSWVGGTWRESWLEADIRELGLEYAITADTVAPKITPVNPAQWVRNETITFRLTDNLSGVDSYRGTIDGHYVLFEMDGKKSLIRYTFDPHRLSRGKHVLSLTVKDACGNVARYEKTFVN